jgi:hypothetical protein
MTGVGRRNRAKLGLYLKKSNKDQANVSVALAYRFLALGAFNENVVEPPKNLCWFFLILTELVFERVAIAHPVLVGYPQGQRPQPIQTTVNKDLQSLYSAAEGCDVSSPSLKAVKVHLPLGLFISHHL